jgi:hypothetical protein
MRKILALFGMVSPVTRGIWLALLDAMYRSPSKGRLTGTVEELTRLAGAFQDDFRVFTRDASVHAFMEVTICSESTAAEIERAERRRVQARNRKRKQRNRETGSVNGHATQSSPRCHA